MDVMRATLEAEKKRAMFFEKACLALEDGTTFLEIRSPSQGVNIKSMNNHVKNIKIVFPPA